MEITPLVPELNENTAHHFVSEERMEPTKVTIHGVEINTQFLLPDMRHDILGMSMKKELIDAGKADYTDRIADNLSISSLLVEKDNELLTVEFGGDANILFRDSVEGGFSDKTLDATFLIAGTTSKKLDRLRIVGNTHLEYGHVEVRQETTDNPPVKLVGYKLDGGLMNSNRRRR